MQISPDMQEHFKFLLLDKFSLMAFSAAVDTLRQANRKVGREPYTWSLCSENGETAMASNGTEVRVDHGLDTLNRDTTLIVCGGVDIKATSNRTVLNWLRRESRRGLRIGGICTAP